jgi:hypothetical protein
MVVATVALVVALSGTAMAGSALLKANGDAIIKKGTLSGNRLRKHTVTGKQINLTKLGTVPASTYANSAGSATSATHASSAGSATSAAHATSADSAANAAELGGQPASAYVRTGFSGGFQQFVGSPGEPTFQNGWSNVGSGFLRAGFYIDPIDRVHLGGVVTGSNPSTTVFTLPPADRPFANLAFSVAAGTGSPAVENVDVFSNGDVFAFGSQTTVSLDGISFRAGD